MWEIFIGVWFLLVFGVAFWLSSNFMISKMDDDDHWLWWGMDRS